MKIIFFTAEYTTQSKHPRSMAVQRQKMALKNSENMIDICHPELELRKQYYRNKLYLQAKKTRQHGLQIKISQNINNKLINPW